MNFCKNCKYWGQGETGSGIGKRCDYVEHEWDSTEWNESGELVLINKNLKAVVKDGSDYWAELRTMPDFYCNQHSQKK